MATSISPAVLQPGIQLPILVAAVVTAAVNTQAVIKRAVFTNPTGGAVTITIHRVPNGGTASTATQIISARSIAAGGTDLAPELVNMVLNAGDMIQALASAATSINCFVSGFVSS